MVGQLFSFQGRATRLEYFLVGFVQLLLIIGVAIAIGSMFAGGEMTNLGAKLMGAVLLLLVGAGVMIWIGLAAVVRRLRDMGWPIMFSLVGAFVLNLVCRLAMNPMLEGMTQDLLAKRAPDPGVLILSLLVSSVSGLILMFWPSAKRIRPEDIADLFGDEDEPELEPAPQQSFRPAFAPPTGGGFGGMEPRTQFGLRKSF